MEYNNNKGEMIKMIKKLSELDNKTLLLAGDNVITKEDILSDLDYYREKYKDDLYTTKEYLLI